MEGSNNSPRHARIFIGLGANLPAAGFADTLATVQAALGRLSEAGLAISRMSSWWESAPVPPSDQPWYINGVASITTALDPMQTLQRLLEIEAAFGRVRSIPNAARVLDLDLLDYQGVIRRSPVLTLPHPRMTERAFVLYPLQEIMPIWTDPVTGQPIEKLIASLPSDQVIRRLDQA